MHACEQTQGPGQYERTSDVAARARARNAPSTINRNAAPTPTLVLSLLTHAEWDRRCRPCSGPSPRSRRVRTAYGTGWALNVQGWVPRHARPPGPAGRCALREQSSPSDNLSGELRRECALWIVRLRLDAERPTHDARCHMDPGSQIPPWSWRCVETHVSD